MPSSGERRAPGSAPCMPHRFASLTNSQRDPSTRLTGVRCRFCRTTTADPSTPTRKFSSVCGRFSPTWRCHDRMTRAISSEGLRECADMLRHELDERGGACDASSRRLGAAGGYLFPRQKGGRRPEGRAAPELLSQWIVEGRGGCRATNARWRCRPPASPEVAVGTAASGDEGSCNGWRMDRHGDDGEVLRPAGR